MKKKVKKIIKQNLIKFGKKSFWRIFGKIVDIIILILIGSAFGLKLVRY